MNANALNGVFFHSDWETQWQGQVIGPVSDSGNYWLVQTFSWADGRDSTLHVVSIHTISDWTLYRSNGHMNNSVDQARARWSREEVKANDERRMETTENR